MRAGGITVSLWRAPAPLVATLADGPRLAEYSARTIEGTALASAFDLAFLFCMGLEVLGIVLMLFVKENGPVESGDGEVAIGFS